jgi:hypothetical protein
MKSIESNVKVKIPVFCPDCRRRNTFMRKPEKDIRTENGRIFETAFCCQFCGYVAYSNSSLDNGLGGREYKLS